MAQDDCTLTIRIHDPNEKVDAQKSATWSRVKFPFDDLKLSEDEFIAKHVKPAFAQLFHWKPKP